MSRTAAERRGWSDNILHSIKGGSAQRRDDGADKPADSSTTDLANAHQVKEDVAVEEARDAVMADHSAPSDIRAGLLQAKAQFNDPFSQLQSLLPYLHDDTLRKALGGRTVEEALVYLKVVSPGGDTRPVVASGSGPTGTQLLSHSNIASAAEFISSKLQRVFHRTEVVPVDEIVELLQACDGDMQLVAEALRKTGMNFMWDDVTMRNEWRDWCDAKITPQAATPISTTMSGMDLLGRPNLYDYNNEASFMMAMVERSNIILHPGINMPDLAKKYQGQFPAMLRKMQISFNTSFPSHWTEKWLMDAYSLWLTGPPSATTTAENAAPTNVAETTTPTNTATRQATAPVINTSADGDRRM